MSAGVRWNLVVGDQPITPLVPWCPLVGLETKIVNVETYPERAPSVYQSVAGERKGRAVGGGQLRKHRSLGKMRRVDGGGCGLLHVEGDLVIVGVGIRLVGSVGRVVHLYRILLCIASECPLVVDAPGKDLVVVRQGGGVHAANGEVHDAHRVGGKLGVQDRAG